jgi:hypothetical protein
MTAATGPSAHVPPYAPRPGDGRRQLRHEWAGTVTAPGAAGPPGGQP